MSIIQSIIDNIGDALGTSKLAQLNNRVFEPVTGTAITRKEYDMCDGANIIGKPTKEESCYLQGLKGYDRRNMANQILDQMIDNGTVFSNRRIARFAALQQSQPGITSLSWKVRDQMSTRGKENLNAALHRAYLAPHLRK